MPQTGQVLIGREIFASSTVADLVVGSGFSFAERGTHNLKGVPGQWRIVAVAHEET